VQSTKYKLFLTCSVVYVFVSSRGIGGVTISVTNSLYLFPMWASVLACFLVIVMGIVDINSFDEVDILKLGQIDGERCEILKLGQIWRKVRW
jgi:hypothetical protein